MIVALILSFSKIVMLYCTHLFSLQYININSKTHTSYNANVRQCMANTSIW